MQILLNASVWLLVSCAGAFACKCVPQIGCPQLGTPGGPVFLGRVIEVSKPVLIGGSDPAIQRKARIRVDETFGGLAPDQREIEIVTGLGGGDCGVPFQPGEEYLVDAHTGKDGLIHASICSSTGRIDWAGAKIQMLRGLRDSRKVPSLFGQIKRVVRNFRGSIETKDPEPMAYAVVRVKSEEGSYETQADVDGFYAFHSLPAGRYEFAPDLPPGTTLSWYIGSNRPLLPIELSGSGCRESDIQVFASGSIQGRVLDSMDRPLPSVLVYIVPAAVKQLPKRRQRYGESQGKKGYFEFVHIPPGEYLVFVDPSDMPTAGSPSRKTFYPGVHDRSKATVITLRAGEEIQNVDIRLRE